MIDMRPHGRRAAGAPRPDARTDIVDYRDRGRGRPDLASYAQAEVRTVDRDQTVRTCSCYRARRLADATQQARQIAQHRTDPHQGNLSRIEKAFQPFFLEMPSAHSDKFHSRAGHRAQCANQIGAEQVSGFLSGDYGETKWPPRAVQVRSPERPTTKRPRASA